MKNSVESDAYIIGGRRFVRVTTLLSFVGHSDFSAIPVRDRAYYMSRGKAFHEMSEHVERGVDGRYTYDAETDKYRAGHANFLRDTGFNSIKNGIERGVSATWEQLGFSRPKGCAEVGVAGTLDRLGAMQGRLALVDYKGSTVPTSTAAQTALYLIMVILQPEFSALFFRDVSRFGVGFKNNGVPGRVGSGYTMSAKYPDSDQQLALRLIEKYLKGERP